MKNYTKQTIKIFWNQTKKHWVSFWVVIFSIIIASLANITAPLYYKDFFDILSGPGSIESKPAILIGILIKILLVYLVAWTFWRITSFTVSYFQTRVMTNLSNTCFAYLHKHSVDFFNNNFVGSLVKRVNRFARAYEGITDALFFEVLQILTNISFIVVVLWYRNIWVGLIILVWIIVYCTINYLFSRYKLKYDIQKSQADTEVTRVLADTITNHQNVKLFTGYDQERKLFEQVTNKWRKLQKFTWNLSNIFEAFQTLLMIVLEIGIFYFAIKLWQKGIFTIGDFVLIQAYIITVFHRLWNFSRVIRRYYEHMADANEMTEILETPHEIQDTKSAKELKVEKGKIEFKDVNFSYHKTRRIFKKLNLVFEPQERVALVGPSGSGKSTLVSLILRNYDVTYGKILIDGHKVSAVTQESLRRNISFVPQEPILFHRSLIENIRYGKPEATDEEVIEAAKLARCHEFVSGFSEGYETFVGERGIKLSGGERQRVSIARAILKNAPILILDEATSSLDSESEGLIQEALKNLMKDKTVIVIAHRLSTIMRMDMIVVLKEGQVVEKGTHDELIKKPTGLYRQLWEKQVGGFIK